jgi:uncharacterized protein (TIGR00730 family)
MSTLTSVCVFCGSSPGARPAFREAAETLGRQLAEDGVSLVFGAGRVGVMGAVSEACLKAGGTVTGVVPEHLTQAEVPVEGLSDLIIVPDMHTRKRIMFDRSDAFVVLPGGFGTMDETFEILTWKQLGLHDKPVILVDIEGYWAPFLRFAESMLAEGFIRPPAMALFRVVHRPEEILPALREEVRNASEKAASDLF